MMAFPGSLQAPTPTSCTKSTTASQDHDQPARGTKRFSPGDGDELRTPLPTRATTRRSAWCCLTGAGDKAFCSGGDQKVRGDGGYVGATTHPAAQRARPATADPHAAQAGHRRGGRVCDRRRPRPARGVRSYHRGGQRHFRTDRPKVGSFDAGYGAALLARIVGHKKAREIWYLCRQYTPRRPSRWGWSTPSCLSKAGGRGGRVGQGDPGKKPDGDSLSQGGL